MSFMLNQGGWLGLKWAFQISDYAQMLWEWLQKSFNVVASHSLHRAPLFHKRDSKCKCTVWIILFKYIETDKEFIKDTMDSTSYLILFFMRPPPAGLINFINVSSCSLIKWAGRVEKTWEKSMYMLLHYCTPERDRVKEVAELRKQTQWPRKKMWMFTYSSHLTCKGCCVFPNTVSFTL